MKFRAALLHACAGLLVALPALATIPQISGFVTQADGNVITAEIWNAQIGDVYSYLNTNVVNAINTLTQKGDMLTYDGSNLQRLGIGANGLVLTADSTQPYGMNWEAVVTSTTLANTGDLLTYQSGTGLVRLPVGSNGQVLTADSTQANGIAWEAPPAVPSGAILLWSGSVASIPAGYVLCDGVQSGSTGTTPNLQGLFVVGAGGTNAPASGGMGTLAPGGPSGQISAGPGLGPSHTHAYSGFTQANSGSSFPAVNGAAGYVDATIITPRYYALCYIMKT
jgi:hypothetical protein